MTQEELKNQISQIEIKAGHAKALAYRQFVSENAKYKVGDIIGDDTDIIRIERISYDIFGSRVSIYYCGPMLTKKGILRKDGARRLIFESAIKRVGI